MSGAERAYKIIVLGSPNVGKTTLTYRFCEKKKLEGNVMPTIGIDFRTKIVTINNEDVKLMVWDTAGMEQHRNSMVSHYYRNAHAVILMYDITCRKTFDLLPIWIDECKKYNTDALMVLVANKCDAIDENIKVTTSEGFKFADENNMPFFKISALDEDFTIIEAIFLTLAIKIMNNRTFMKPLPPALPAIENNPTYNSGCCYSFW